jgi:predicted secreted protein
MAVTAAFWAAGSLLQIGDAAVSEAFTSIAEITKLNPPKRSRDEIEVTHTTSPDGYREFLPAWRDAGEISYEANWIPTNTTQDETTGLLATFHDNVTHNFRIVIPAVGLYFPFTGFVTAYEPDLDIMKQGTLSGTIRVTTKPGAPVAIV